MRVLLAVRPDAASRHGGDVVVAENSAAALRALGHDVDVVAGADFDARGYDIAHLFSIFEPELCERQLDAAERGGARIALSGIWMDRLEFAARAPRCEKALAERSAERALSRLSAIRGQDPGRALGRRERARFDARVRRHAACAQRAHVLLPNSAMAARECALHLGVAHIPCVVVPVAVDHDEPVAWTREREGVVCVGRLESLKNQAMLSFAVRDGSQPLTLAGLAYDAYYEALCRRWGGQALTITGHMTRARILELMARAAVHALPSWGDLPGIASLEAAAAGARVVVGDRGSEIEYFEEDADYADPADPDSIRAAITRALARPPRFAGDALDRRVRALTWKRAAEATARGYEIALGARPS